jgi:hypothetical protein
MVPLARACQPEADCTTVRREGQGEKEKIAWAERTRSKILALPLEICYHIFPNLSTNLQETVIVQMMNYTAEAQSSQRKTSPFLSAFSASLRLNKNLSLIICSITKSSRKDLLWGTKVMWVRL